MSASIPHVNSQQANKLAKNLRKQLSEEGLEVAHSKALNMVAKMFGAKNHHCLQDELPSIDSLKDLCGDFATKHFISGVSGDYSPALFAVKFNQQLISQVASHALSAASQGSRFLDFNYDAYWFEKTPDEIDEILEDNDWELTEIGEKYFELLSEEKECSVEIPEWVIDQDDVQFSAVYKHSDDTFWSQPIYLADFLPELSDEAKERLETLIESGKGKSPIWIEDDHFCLRQDECIMKIPVNKFRSVETFYRALLASLF